jgi:hypothetical protein
LKVIVKDISQIPVFREDARKVFEIIKSYRGEEVVVDFKGVEVGLSFAKEFLTLQAAHTNKRVKAVNLSNKSSRMFQIARKSLRRKRRNWLPPPSKVEEFKL